MDAKSTTNALSTPIASSALLDEMVPAAEISSATKALTLALGDGSIAVLYQGKNQQLFLVRQDASSETGWSRETLPAPPGSIAMFSAALGAHGVVVAASSGTAGALWSIARDPEKGWSASWTTLPALSTVSTSASLQGLQVAPPQNGSSAAYEIWTWVVPTAPQNSMWSFTYAGSGTWQQSMVATDAGLQSSQPNADLQPIRVVDTLTIGRGSVFNGRQYLQFDGMYIFPLEGFCHRYPIIAEATQSDGSPALWLQDPYGTDENGHTATVIRYIDGAGIQNDGQPMERQLGQVDMVSMAATSAADEHPLTLLGVADGKLYVWQPGQPSSGDDGEIIELGIPADALATTAHGASLTDFVAIRGGTLVHVWQNPIDAPDQPGAWNAEDIELPTSSDVVAATAHVTTLRITDASGRPIANATLTLRAVDEVPLRAGGQVYTLGGSRRVTLTTDGGGRARFSTPAERSSALRLQVDVSGQDEDGNTLTGSWNVYASVPVLKQMVDLDQAELRQLVQEDDIRKQLTDMLGDAKAAAAVSKYELVEPVDKTRPAATLSGQGRAYRIERRGGKVSMTPITAQAFEAARAKASPVPKGGLMSWYNDAVEALEYAATDGLLVPSATVVFDIVTGAVGAVIELVVDGALRAYQIVTHVVDEFMDTLQAVWEALGVAWDRLKSFIGWIISDMRADVWRVYKLIKNQLDTAPATLAKVLSGLLDDLSDMIERARQELLSPDLADAEASAGTDYTVPSYDDDFTSARALVDEHVSALTSVFDQVLSLGSASGLTVSLPADAVARMDRAFATLTSEVMAKVESRGKPLIDYVEQQAQKGLSTMDATTMKEVFTSLGEGVAAEMLGALEDVLRALAKALSEVITVIGQDVFQLDLGEGVLYYMLNLWNTDATWEKATVNAIVALLLAAPATILYKVITDEALVSASAAGATGTLAKVCLYASGAAQIIDWNVFDVMLDAGSGFPEWMNVVVANAFPFAMQILAWPGGPNSSPASLDPQKPDFWRWLGWLTAWCPPFYNFWASLKQDFLKTGRSPEWVKGLSAVGFIALLGAFAKASGLTVLHQDTAWDWVAAFGPLPVPFKPLKGRGAYAQAALCGIDVAGNTCGGLAKIVQSKLFDAEESTTRASTSAPLAATAAA